MVLGKPRLIMLEYIKSTTLMDLVLRNGARWLVSLFMKESAEMPEYMAFEK